MDELSDTTPKAREAYWKRLAEMTPAERTHITARLWTIANEVQRGVMRQRFPDADEMEISYQIAITRFGYELASKAYGRR